MLLNWHQQLDYLLHSKYTCMKIVVQRSANVTMMTVVTYLRWDDILCHTARGLDDPAHGRHEKEWGNFYSLSWDVSHLGGAQGFLFRDFLREVLVVFTDQSVLFSFLNSVFISVCSLASSLFLPAGLLGLQCSLASILLLGWKKVSPQSQLLVVSVVEICFKQIFPGSLPRLDYIVILIIVCYICISDNNIKHFSTLWPLFWQPQRVSPDRFVKGLST